MHGEDGRTRCHDSSEPTSFPRRRRGEMCRWEDGLVNRSPQQLCPAPCAASRRSTHPAATPGAQPAAAPHQRALLLRVRVHEARLGAQGPWLSTRGCCPHGQRPHCRFSGEHIVTRRCTRDSPGKRSSGPGQSCLWTC